MENTETGGESEIDIEKIMQDIRHEILLKKRIGKRELPVGGERFSAKFYEQLYQAELLQADLGIRFQVTKSNIPLIGGLIDRLRAKIHELVVFYVNQAVTQQAEINDHMIEAITLLSAELEEGAGDDREEGRKNNY